MTFSFNSDLFLVLRIYYLYNYEIIYEEIFYASVFEIFNGVSLIINIIH